MVGQRIILTPNPGSIPGLEHFIIIIMGRHREIKMDASTVIKSAANIQGQQVKKLILLKQSEIRKSIAEEKAKSAEPNKLYKKGHRIFSIGTNIITNPKSEVQEYMEEHFNIRVKRVPFIMLSKK